MIDKIKKLIMFIAIIFGVTLFAAEDKKAPNEIIKDNPKKEVTTVESMKVRDHATMSLSVTKSKPEEIMGSLSEDGKLSVFLYKKQAKKSTRSGSTKDIDVKNFKLKAYTNTKNDNPMMLRANTKDKNMPQNLSAEDIRSMMNSNAASKEKKINVVEETNEYVRLEVEDVQENEKVYISVMNGDSVVKSYRIGNPKKIQGRINCLGLPNEFSYEDQLGATAFFTDDSDKGGYAFDGIFGKAIIFDTTIGNIQARYINNGRVITAGTPNPTGNMKLELDDNSFQGSNVYKTSAVLEMALRLEDVDRDTQDIYTIETNKGKLKGHISDLESPSSGRGYIGWLKSEYAPSGAPAANSVWYTELKGINDTYEKYGCTIDTFAVIKRRIDRVALRLFVPKDARIGAYKYERFGFEIAQDHSPRIGMQQQYKVVKKDKYDREIKKIWEANIGDEFELSKEIGSENYGEYSLSFGGDFQGIYKDNNTKLTNGTPFEIIGKTNTSNKIKVTVTQEAGKYAKLKINVVNLVSTDTFIFKLSQKYIHSPFYDEALRNVNYEITLLKTNSLGSLNYNIDSRIENATYGEWVNNAGELKDKNGTVQEILPEMVGAWTDIKNENFKNKQITDIISINTQTGNQLGNDTSKNYKYLQNSGNNKFALPYNVSSDNYINNGVLVNKQDLDENITQNKTITNSFILKDNNGTFWNGTMNENYLGSKNPNRSSGNIDFSTATVGREYVFNPGVNNPNSNGLILTTGNSLDAKGRLQKNNTKNIATKIEVVATTKDGKSSTQIIKRADVRAGNRVEPTAIGILENKIAIGINGNGGLILKRVSDEGLTGDTKKVKIKYFYSGDSTKTGVLLGEFDLTITMKKDTIDLGESTVKIDSRIAQLSDTYSWLKLRTGEVFNLEKNGKSLGNYSDFIGVPSAFSKASSFSQYNKVKISNIEEINDSSDFGKVDDYFSTDGIIYKGIVDKPEDQAAYPTEQTLDSFIDTNEKTTKLVVSKWKVNSAKHTKDNKFLVSGMDGNQPVAFTGNLKEIYLDKNGREIAGNINKDQNIFSGSGTLNLAPAVVGTSYWFAKTGSRDLKGNGNNNEIILKLDSNSDPLNAAGVLPKSNNKRVANKMVLTVAGSQKPDIDLSNGKLEEELTIGDGKVKIAIDSSGRLEVTKTQEGNIPSTSIEIKYYYKSSTNMANNEIHLGTFTLTIENPVITSTKDVTVEIDKRFESLEGYNWLFRDGKVSDDIFTNGKTQEFSNFFNYSNSLDSQSGTIIRDIGMTDREVKNGGSTTVAYGIYHLNGKSGTDAWKGEGAVPRTGDMSQLNNLITVSKGNDPNDSKSLENEFSLLFTDNNNKYSIYKGKITEEIKGIGKYSGSGKIKQKDLIKDTKYTFSTIMTKMGTIPSDNNLSIESATGIPVNALGVVSGKTSTVVANKIIVKYKEENGNMPIKQTIESNGNLEVSLTGLKVGVDSSTGGLTLEKTAEKINITEIVVEYLYEANPNGTKKVIELGEFTLTIEKDTITIDPDDAFLDFGKMFYDSRDGGETHETRVKSFKVINDTGKDIDFRVEKNTGEMLNNSNKLELRNISVKKDSNTKFTLQATAVLNENTQSGSYEGTIEVIVDIVTPSKP